MRRREFSALLASAAFSPLSANAQQTERMRRIGVLHALSETDPDVRQSLPPSVSASLTLVGVKEVMQRSSTAGAQPTLKRYNAMRRSWANSTWM